MNKKLITAAGIIILILANLIIFNRENLLRKGDVVLLELAPVDPRSLMQGDYMALRYAIENKISKELEDLKPDNSFVILNIDENRVGTFSKIHNGEPLLDNEIKMFFRVRNEDLKIATNAYFFQEGDGSIYENARYGEFRIKRGTVILTGLIDKYFNKLGEK